MTARAAAQRAGLWQWGSGRPELQFGVLSAIGVTSLVLTFRDVRSCRATAEATGARRMVLTGEVRLRLAGGVGPGRAWQDRWPNAEFGPLRSGHWAVGASRRGSAREPVLYIM